MDDRSSGLGYRMILLTGAAGNANGPHNFGIALYWDATAKDHDLAVVRGVDTEELVAGLRVLAKGLGLDVERSGGPGFLGRDIDRTHPGVGHALEGQEVSAGTDDGDAHGLAKRFCLDGGCSDDGAGFGESDRLRMGSGRCAHETVDPPKSILIGVAMPGGGARSFIVG